MRILISGASGFIGTPLSFYLKTQGNEVVRLIRPTVASASDTIEWNPEEGRARKEDFEGFDAVIHLAGEPLTLGRWNQKKRAKILFSRTIGTSFLSHLLSLTYQAPKLFISASAFGYYGDRGEELLTESSVAGHGFLPSVCSAWEQASRAIEERGARVVHTRFGIVLGPRGGAVQKMVPAYRMGLGARLGSGKQWVSWIALHDLIHAFDHIIRDETIVGPVNFVSPHPVRQIEFSKTLAHLLHRPHFLSIPSWALTLRFGLSAKELLLASARVEPTKLLATKFSFKYSDLHSALIEALNN